jgi:hypothetical protein
LMAIYFAIFLNYLIASLFAGLTGLSCYSCGL